MIIDTSALVAVLRAEPAAPDVARTLEKERTLRISAATLVEAYLVVGPEREKDLEDLLALTGMRIEPVDAAQTRLARDGHRRFGRGTGHRARLNFGDCFSYACAAAFDEPLLFIGDDFPHTDIRPAI